MLAKMNQKWNKNGPESSGLKSAWISFRWAPFLTYLFHQCAVWHSANVQISLKQSFLIMIDVNQLNVIHMRLYFKIIYVYIQCIYTVYIYIHIYIYIYIYIHIYIYTYTRIHSIHISYHIYNIYKHTMLCWKRLPIFHFINSHVHARPFPAIPCHGLITLIFPLSKCWCWRNICKDMATDQYLHTTMLAYFDICFGGMNIHESPFWCSSRKEIHGWPELAHTSKPPNRPQQLILLPQILPCSPGGLCFLLQRQLQRCLHCLFFNRPVLAEVRSMFFKA